MRYAIIDVGSNSIKFHMVEKLENGDIKTIYDENNISRLGEDINKTSLLKDEAIERNIEVFKNFVNKAKNYGVDKIEATGTMCLRVAKNSSIFIDKVLKETGVKVEIIDGTDEAKYSYLAVISGIKDIAGDIAIFDTGGGSTEFIFGDKDGIKDRFSLNIGSVILKDKFINSDPTEKEEVLNIENFLSDIFNQNSVNRKVDHLIGIGGTVTSLAAIKHKMAKYDPDIIDGSIIDKKELIDIISNIKSKTVDERKKIVGLQPKRADVILTGSLIVKKIMDNLNISTLKVSDRGLRHGVVYDRFMLKKW